MKLEFLYDLTDNGRYPQADPEHLIRLYDFDQEEAKQLKEEIEKNLLGEEGRLHLAQLDFIEPLNCTLVLEAASGGTGILYPADGKSFVCRLPPEAYENIADIISHFTDEASGMAGYNRFYDPPEGGVDLLFSPGGTW